jgi:hypothetical protein
VTAVVLVPVVPVPQLQSFNHPTRVVMTRIPSSLSILPFIFTSWGRSHNVIRFGCRGFQVLLSGAFSICPRSALESALSLTLPFISRHIVLSTFMASSLGEIPSTSPKALCPPTLTPTSDLIGLLISLAKPISLLLLAMIAESVPAAFPHTWSLLLQTYLV